jgi:hypothetical protein
MTLVKWTGVIFFSVVAIAAAVVVAYLISLAWALSPEAGAVLLTGVAGVAAAIWALYSQRSITRRQTTFDHIARTEADGDLIRGLITFREMAKKPEGLVVWAAADKEQTTEFQAIVTRLNEFELVSIGIQRGIIDFELWSRWFKVGTIRAWNDSEPFIMALRKRFGNDVIFHEFAVLKDWLAQDTKPPRRSRWFGNWF